MIKAMKKRVCIGWQFREEALGGRLPCGDAEGSFGAFRLKHTVYEE